MLDVPKVLAPNDSIGFGMDHMWNSLKLQVSNLRPLVFRLFGWVGIQPSASWRHPCSWILNILVLLASVFVIAL
jgi:hypothetical protein